MKLPYLAIILFAFNPGAQALEAQVAVAANFAVPAQQIIAAFTRDHVDSHKIVLIVGSTGKLYAQISNGAPFDILLAADDAIPARLEKERGAVAGSRFTYAVGTLLLWSANAGYVDAQGHVLKQAPFKHLAVANPKLAPYGAAAFETITALGLSETLQTRWVQGENIAQTHQFIASANAELGFVAASQVMFDGKLLSGSAWIVPEKLHAPIRQDAVLLQHGKDNASARAFLDYLKSPTAQAIIKRYGYH